MQSLPQLKTRPDAAEPAGTTPDRTSAALDGTAAVVGCARQVLSRWCRWRTGAGRVRLVPPADRFGP